MNSNADTNELNSAALFAWQERQRRQRTLRMLLMLLLLLVLMDGDDTPDRRNIRLKHPDNRTRNTDGTTDRSGVKYSKFGMMYIDENGDLISPLNKQVFKYRREQDRILLDSLRDNENSRFADLIKKNNGWDVEDELRRSVGQKIKDEYVLNQDLGLDENVHKGNNEDEVQSELQNDSVTDPQSDGGVRHEEDTPVFHYPRNATGYYRGLWLRLPVTNTSKDNSRDVFQISHQLGEDSGAVTLEQIHPWIQHQLSQKKEDASILLLPPNLYLDPGTIIKNSTNEEAEMKNDSNWSVLLSTATQSNHDAESKFQKKAITNVNFTTKETTNLSLTKDAGRATFQLYSRPIPAMNELSIVDGLVKLYDGMTNSFVSRRTDVLLRVRGVIIHSVGKISLVRSSMSGGSFESRRRSVFGIKQVAKNQNKKSHEALGLENITVKDFSKEKDDGLDSTRHRRLQDRVNAFISDSKSTAKRQTTYSTRDLIGDLKSIRDDVIDMYFPQYANEIVYMTDDVTQSMKEDGWSLLQSLDEDDMVTENSERLVNGFNFDRMHRSLNIDNFDNSTEDLKGTTVEAIGIDHLMLMPLNDGDHSFSSNRSTLFKQHVDGPTGLNKVSEANLYAYPFPYVFDDAQDSMKKASSTTRRLPTRELPLEANAANCEFEININVHETKWTLGEWRMAMEHQFRIIQAFNPSLNKLNGATDALKKSQILMMKSQVDFLEKDPIKEALVLSMDGSIESPNCDFISFVNVTAIRTNWEKTTAKAINYSFYMMLTCLTQIVVLLRQLLHTQAQSAASNVSLVCIGWQTVLDAILCIAHIFLCLVMQPLFTAFASVAFFKLLIFCVIEMKYMALIIQARNNSINPAYTQDDMRRQLTLLHLRFYAALMLAIMSFWYFGQSQRMLFILVLYSFWVPQIILNVITEARKPMHHYYIYGMSFTRLVAPLYVFAVRKNFLQEVNPDFPSDPNMCSILLLWIVLQTAVLIGQGRYGTRFMIPQRFLPPKFNYHRPIPPSLLSTSQISTSSNETPSEIELGPLITSDSTPRGTRNRRSRVGPRVDDSNGTTTLRTEAPESSTLDCVICYNEIDVNDSIHYMLAPCLHIFHSTCLQQWMEVKMECPICRCNLPAI